MKKINIKGKEYVEVNERVIYFRQNFGTKEEMFGINTQIVEWDKENKEVIARAWITDQKDRTVASGLAHESQHDKSSFVNATSYVENCETSAIGRALAAMGIGIEDAYASADEVQRAVEQQKASKNKKNKDKTDDLIKQMESNTTDGKTKFVFVDDVKLELSKIFAESTQWTGAMAEQKNELIENIMREGTTDMEEYDIKDFAIANPGNKEKLKKYCETHMGDWKKSLTKEIYNELIQFMTYLNKKFEEEDV